MTHAIPCHRCGGSLAALSLPLSRRDECPHCRASLHVCLQCRHYDATVPRQCREDDADDVSDKERVNFCDYFEPGTDVFNASRKAESDAAESALDALFGDGEAPDTTTEPSDAEKLFK